MTVLTKVSAQEERLVTDETVTEYEGTSYLVVEKLSIKPQAGEQFRVSASEHGPFHIKMYNKNNNVNGSLNKNYVRIETSNVQGLTNEYSFADGDIEKKSISFEYINGLNQKEQINNVQSSPLMKDLVELMVFDNMGNVKKSYLPYKSGSNNGSYRSSAGSEVSSYYTSLKSDNRPFTENLYENSPLRRIIGNYGPGQAWNNATVNKKRESVVVVNGSNELKDFKIVNGLPTYDNYPANSLMGNMTVDEDGRSVIEYKNFRDQTVVKRVKSGTSSWYDTYYVYDNIGNLRFVLPPEAVGRLAAEYDGKTTSVKQTFLNSWAFQYKYDDRQRLIGKRVPGTNGWLSMVYDRWDRLVLTQDANQSLSNQWIYTKYDEFNRPIMTGLWTQSGDQEDLADDVMAETVRFENRNTTAEGYTRNRTFPKTASTSSLLSITYYDDYNFIVNSNWDMESLSFGFTNESELSSSKTTHGLKGQMTGTKVKIDDGTNTWLNSVNYYDDKYRVIQVVAENHRGGLDRTSHEYDFLGKTIKTKRYHSSTGDGNLIVIESFEYDHAGRLLKTYHSLNGGTNVLIAENNYNEIGELIETNYYAPNGSKIQSVDYDYNIRGWLTKINDDNLSDGEGDLFGMQLNYETPRTINGSATAARYNGNINSISWKTDNLEETSVAQIYGYIYDWLDRFKTARYATKNGSSWSGDADAFKEAVTSYDKNGNIIHLDRWANGTKIDGLGYGYEGNQLINVTDGTSKDLGFKDLPGSPTGLTEYDYDDNGNMTQDLNKGIDISYNRNNLPVQVVFENNNKIEYIYDALGNKLSTVVTEVGTAQPIRNTDYISGIQYEDNAIDFVSIPYGRVVKRDGNWDYEYFLKDHLGNTRATFGYTRETNSYLATLEDEPSDEEAAEFIEIDAKSSMHNYTKASLDIQNPNNSLLLRNGAMGAGKFLEVAQGDKIQLSAFAHYNAASGDPSQIAGAIVSAVSGGFGAAIGGTEGGLIQTGLNNQLPGVVNDIDYSTGEPKAYLIYLLFKEDYSGVPLWGAEMVTLDAAAGWQELDLQYEIPYNGNLLVYVANESDVDVFFDDMQYTHIKNNNVLEVTQTQDYYPGGLTFNSYRRSYSAAQNYLFNGKERQSELGWDDFGARYYMPDLMRWTSIDPMASERDWLTPYNFVQNNPILRVDPTGMLDDYYIYEDGAIERQVTEGNTDTFYHVDKDNNVTDLGTFEKNENGLIQLPSSYSINEGDVSFSFEVKGGQTDRAYVNPESMASLFGAFAETGYDDFTITQFSYSDGTSPSPSTSHINGKNGDFRYLRYDQSGTGVTVNDAQFDQARNARFTTALDRFGYSDLKSYRYNAAWDNMLLPKTSHLGGHHNHLHLQGYNPRVVDVKLPTTFYINQSSKLKGIK